MLWSEQMSNYNFDFSYAAAILAGFPSQKLLALGATVASLFDLSRQLQAVMNVLVPHVSCIECTSCDSLSPI